MSYNFEIKKTYSFRVYPAGILGNNFDNVTVLGILDRATAQTITNITTKHPLIYPTLPSGSPEDPDDYTYLKIRFESGDITAIAQEWIQPNSIQLVEEATCVVRLQQFSPAKLTLLREVLSANGFRNFTVTMTSEK